MATYVWQCLRCTDGGSENSYRAACAAAEVHALATGHMTTAEVIEEEKNPTQHPHPHHQHNPNSGRDTATRREAGRSASLHHSSKISKTSSTKKL